MDNDIKVEKRNSGKVQTHDEVLLFLDEELKSLNKGTSNELYDIKKEYAKTTKNRSWFSAFILMGTAAAVILIALIMSTVINSRDQKISVSLEAFDDLNLRNLLDSVSKVQTNYDDAVKTKANLQGELSRRIREAEELRDNEIFVLETLKLSSAAFKKRSADINNVCDETIKALKAEYGPRIDEAQSKIDVYKTQMDDFNSSRVESAREKEMELNSERQLRDLERKELTQKYENSISKLETSMETMRVQNREEIRRSVKEVQEKYQAEIDALDPVLVDGKASSIVDGTRASFVSDFSGNRFIYDNNIVNDNISQGFNKYQQYYDNYSYLNSKVAAIPQKNTIPSYVAANNKLVKEMGATFETTALNLYKQNKQLQAEYDMAKNNMEQIYTGLLTSAKANAVVIAADSQEDVRVFIIERARYLIKEETGGTAELVVGKTITRGRIFLCEDGIYRFYTNEDADGNPLPLEVSELAVGTIVKLLGR